MTMWYNKSLKKECKTKTCKWNSSCFSWYYIIGTHNFYQVTRSRSSHSLEVNEWLFFFPKIHKSGIFSIKVMKLNRSSDVKVFHQIPVRILTFVDLTWNAFLHYEVSWIFLQFCHSEIFSRNKYVRQWSWRTVNAVKSPFFYSYFLTVVKSCLTNDTRNFFITRTYLLRVFSPWKQNRSVHFDEGWWKCKANPLLVTSQTSNKARCDFIEKKAIQSRGLLNFLLYLDKKKSQNAWREQKNERKIDFHITNASAVANLTTLVVRLNKKIRNLVTHSDWKKKCPHLHNKSVGDEVRIGKKKVNFADLEHGAVKYTLPR